MKKEFKRLEEEIKNANALMYSQRIVNEASLDLNTAIMKRIELLEKTCNDKFKEMFDKVKNIEEEKCLWRVERLERTFTENGVRLEGE
jgi:transcriptional accessory protein Tex/SPT6